MPLYTCPKCQHSVFFENTECLNCGAMLGFDPVGMQMLAFAPPIDVGAPWPRLGESGAPMQPCQTRIDFSACNWMVTDDDPQHLCQSCRLTATRPDLRIAGHRQQWAAYEQAKRRLVYGLMKIGLKPEPKQGPGDNRGLGFHFLASQPGQPPVMTGHDLGTIILRLDEADSVYRESVRSDFGEPWRTLLGHTRHESSHYLQYRWIATDSQATHTFRAVFGDERIDYGQALAHHHADGPPADWDQHYISAYASAHPHEDWAETCAHVLLVLDAVETAQAWGVSVSSPAATAQPSADQSNPPSWTDLMLAQWLPVAQLMNAINRSIGLADSYPFLIPPQVVRKMSTAARRLRDAAKRNGATLMRPIGSQTGYPTACGTRSASRP